MTDEKKVESLAPDYDGVPIRRLPPDKQVHGQQIHTKKQSARKRRGTRNREQGAWPFPSAGGE